MHVPKFQNLKIFKHLLIIIYLTFRHKWIPEIRKHAPNTPFLLVGTNVELRAAQKAMEKMGFSKQIAISKEQGVRFAKQLKAFKYLECSAITQVGTFILKSTLHC